MVAQFTDPDWWLKAITKVGFPIVVACAVGYALWTGGWHLLSSHDRFIQHQMSVSDKTMSLQEQTVQTQRDIAERQSEIHELTRDNNFMLRALSGRGPAGGSE